jgi:hypothetical protein
MKKKKKKERIQETWEVFLHLEKYIPSNISTGDSSNLSLSPPTPLPMGKAMPRQLQLTVRVEGRPSVSE